LCKDDMLYICIFSNKFDLIQAIRVSHKRHRIVNSLFLRAKQALAVIA
jgi:hypothetical protein